MFLRGLESKSEAEGYHTKSKDTSGEKHGGRDKAVKEN